MLEDHREILKKLEMIEKKDVEQDDKIMRIFKYLKQLETTREEAVKYNDHKPMEFDLIIVDYTLTSQIFQSTLQFNFIRTKQK